MPVSVALGGDPAYTYAATAPMPDNMDEYLLAGFPAPPSRETREVRHQRYLCPGRLRFRDRGLCRPCRGRRLEGPSATIRGSIRSKTVIRFFHVTALTRRRDAVYPATVVGIPPQDACIAQATERIFLAPIRMAVQPEIRDLWMPTAGNGAQSGRRLDRQALRAGAGAQGGAGAVGRRADDVQQIPRRRRCPRNPPPTSAIRMHWRRSCAPRPAARHSRPKGARRARPCDGNLGVRRKIADATPGAGANRRSRNACSPMHSWVPRACARSGWRKPGPASTGVTRGQPLLPAGTL